MFPPLPIRTLLLAVVVLCSVRVSLGQGLDQANSKGSLTLGGTVTNEKTGEAVPHAFIQLAPGVRPGIFSDAGGRFLFRDLAKQSYSLSVQKPHFTQTDMTAAQVELTQSREDIPIRITPLSTISGSVRSQGGERISPCNVQLFSQSFSDGRSVWGAIRSVQADDQGRFRLWDLPEGRYKLQVSSAGSETQIYAGDASSVLRTHIAFPPTYSNGAVNGSEAEIISLPKGEMLQEEISVQLQPAHAVTGTLSGFDKTQTVSFELVNDLGESTQKGALLNMFNGQFSLDGVEPGRYRLRALQGNLFTEIPVEVTSHDVSGVKLQLAEPPSLSGTFVLDQPLKKTSTPSPSDTISDFPFVVTLISYEPHTYPQFPSAADPTGAFQISNIRPGTYYVQVTGQGHYPASVIYGETELNPHQAIVIASDSKPLPLRIQLKSDTGGLSGKLKHPSESLDWQVVAVPNFASFSSPSVAYLEPGDHFKFLGLAPGSYTLFAMQLSAPVEYANAEVLASLTKTVQAEVRSDKDTEVALEAPVQ